MNLLRERRPTEYEFDPNITKAIRTGEHQHDSADADRIINSRRDGLIGIISNVESDISDALDESLVSDFNRSDPEGSMRQFLRRARETTHDADICFVKVYRDESGALLGTYGSAGRQRIYLQKGNSIESLTDSEVEKVDTIRLEDGDRLVIRSVDAVGSTDEEHMTRDEMNDAMAINKPKKAAQAFSDKAGSAVVLDVLSTEGGIGWLTSRFHKDRDNTDVHESDRDDDRRRGLGRLALGGGTAAVATYIGSKWADRRSRRAGRHDDDNVVRERVVTRDDPVVHEEPTRSVAFVEPDTTAGSTRMTREYEVGDTRRSNRRSRRPLLIGALVVSSVLALRFGVDLGDEVSGWIGDRPDTGVDPWPFGDGDKDDGNRSGVDFNPSNENSARNDDPVNENFRDTGGFDVIPLADGDWFSMNEGLNIDWPGGEGEPGTDLDKDGDVDDSEATGDTPDQELDLPEETAPEEEPVAPPPPAPPAWVPDNFTIEHGHGLLREIHDMGHEVAGYENFTNADATRILDQARDLFGDNLISLPDHAGNDIYHVGDDPRISASGQAHWASQAIEQFMFEEMRRIAEEKAAAS